LEVYEERLRVLVRNLRTTRVVYWVNVSESSGDGSPSFPDKQLNSLCCSVVIVGNFLTQSCSVVTRHSAIAKKMRSRSCI